MLVFLAKYLWDSFFLPEKSITPVEYQYALENKEISAELKKASLHYTDKARYYFFWLQLRYLKKSGVPGAMAELGVYQGETAYLLKLIAPERSLHLFDTFSGFPPQDLLGETGEAATYTSKNFSDVSLQEVKSLFTEFNDVYFYPGYFPDSAKNLDENLKFAFVSIDVDLYKPTLEGLRFFYPKLVKGGVMLIHDYTHKWEGLQKAVNTFLDEVDVASVFIPDRDGTLCIVKLKD